MVSIIKVHEVWIETEGKRYKRYMIVDDQGIPLQPAMKYIKYLDSIEKSTNTLRAYCYHLKLYFEFLESCDATVGDVSLTLLGEFVAWLRGSPQGKVVPLRSTDSKRSKTTINTILTCVMSFYEFLLREELITKNVSDQVTRQISGRFKTYKPFLHHISKGKSIGKNILKLKPTRTQVKTLTAEQVDAIYLAIPHIRDQLLLRILHEGGLRISEALGLEITDFNINQLSIRVGNSKTAAGEGRIVYVSAEVMNLFKMWLIDMPEDYDGNKVFFTLKGENREQPLTYEGVIKWVRRLRKKTGIYFTPHMLRHTYATVLHANGVDVAILQRLLGHKHYQTTVNIYVHPSDETIRKGYDEAMRQKTTNKEVNNNEKNNPK